MKLAPVLFGRNRRAPGIAAIVAAVVGSLVLAGPIAATADDTGATAGQPSADAGADPRISRPDPAKSGAQPPTVAGANCSNGFHCLFFFDVFSSKKQYFDSVDHFRNDTFGGGDGFGAGQPVNNNAWAASNSSTGNRESHYYDGEFHSGFLFCVNPGATVNSLPSNLRERASSLRLRPRTSVVCLSN
ncbi:MAG TPA: hypothetical protein VFV67_19990 [Actinophytocola sp.]|uniref:hypothetical protein n=1 Tax=Actinophytocola sp. TaxID=1872138 RepID=UPI002DB58999|nr:hypothetical protein [Actinophytocola sp.]HEU5472932.1 hypothetical protein [Actinophytocola sp.]